MKTLRLIATALVLTPALAFAHPGHDGHELTWDFHSHGAWDIIPATLVVGAIFYFVARRRKAR